MFSSSHHAFIVKFFHKNSILLRLRQIHVLGGGIRRARLEEHVGELLLAAAEARQLGLVDLPAPEAVVVLKESRG